MAKPALFFSRLHPDGARATQILGGGLTSAIQRRARVFSPEGCVGVVDDALPHLSRLRLPFGKGMELPGMMRAGDVVLKRRVPAILGILKGRGAIEDQAGVIERVGSATRVRLTALEERESQLAVENARLDLEAGGVFEDDPIAAVLLERGTHTGPMIDRPRNERLLPGMAFHFGSRYLGRVQSVSSVGARVVSPFDPDVETAVEFCFLDGQAVQGSLIGGGDGATMRAVGRPLVEGSSELVLTRDLSIGYRPRPGWSPQPCRPDSRPMIASTPQPQSLSGSG